jgi:hypothetical protein
LKKTFIKLLRYLKNRALIVQMKTGEIIPALQRWRIHEKTKYWIA